MFNKITIDYLNDFLDIYEDICVLGENKFEELATLKKEFLRLIEKSHQFNLLQISLTSEQEDFLNEYQIENFEETHKLLECIAFYYIVSDVFSCLMIGRDKKYYYKVMEFNQLKFFKNYKESYTYIENYSEENESSIEYKLVKHNENIITDKIKHSQSQLAKIKREQVSGRRLLVEEIEHIVACIQPYLNEYKQFVEANFYDVKELFQFYNIDLRVYIGNAWIVNPF